MLKNKFGISPVVATALLLVVAVVSAVGFQIWFSEFSSLVFIDVESQSSNSAGLVEIDNLIGETLYVVNNNVNSVNVSKFSVGGVDCDLGELKPGMNEIDISHCVEKISVGKVDLLLVSDTSVFEKQIYLDEEFSSSAYFGPSNVFVSVWDTRLNSSGSSSNKTQINLPLKGSNADYNFNISWGDGTNETISTNVALHDYAEPGVYQIEIDGMIKVFRFGNGGDRNKLLDIKQWGNLKVGYGGMYFYGCSNLVGTFRDTLNLTGVTDLHSMFQASSSFNGDISNWDVSNVNDTSSMFRYASSFNRDLNNWNMSKVKLISKMFYSASSFNGDISTWDVSRVSSTWEMFYHASSFNSDISNWNVSNVVVTGQMFSGASSFNQDISGWDVSNITNMYYMFISASSFNQNLSSWNVSKVDTCPGFEFHAFNWSLPKPNFTNCTY